MSTNNENPFPLSNIFVLIPFSCLALFESYRMVYHLTHPNYRFRLSCYFSHVVSMTLIFLLWSHFFYHTMMIIESTYPSTTNPKVPSVSDILPSLVTFSNFVLLTTLHLSDLIALLFTALLTFFIVNKSNKSLVTPVQNQPITVFRIWNNVYIHYIPAVILRLIKGFNDKDLSNTCLAGAVGLLGCWLGRYWEFFDDAYGLKIKGGGARKGGKKEMVRDRIILWCGTVGAATVGIRGWLGV